MFPDFVLSQISLWNQGKFTSGLLEVVTNRNLLVRSGLKV